MEKIGIFGGSFNPPGLHHHRIVEIAVKYFNTLIVLPCGLRQDKASVSVVDVAERKELVRLNFLGLPNVEVDNFDLEGEGRSFTPTWKVQEKFSEPENEIWHIIGPDLLIGGAEGQSEIQRSWDKGNEIWQTLNFAVVQTDGYFLPRQDLPPNSLLITTEKFYGRSTQIRKLIASGQPFENFLLPAVAERIKSQQLYGYQKI